jgi:hypothetical protein
MHCDGMPAAIAMAVKNTPPEAQLLPAACFILNQWCPPLVGVTAAEQA